MRVLALAVAVSLLTACTDGLATAPAERPQFAAFATVLPTTYEGVVCNGDVVALAGSSHIVFGVTAAGSGSFYVRTQVNSKTSGQGLPSGISYYGKQETTDLQYFHAQQGSGTFTVVETISVNGRSAADNFLMHTVFRLTLDADGIPTAAGVDHAFVKCGGETVGS